MGLAIGDILGSLRQTPTETRGLEGGGALEFHACAEFDNGVWRERKIGSNVAGVARHPRKDRSAPAGETNFLGRENCFAADEICRAHRLKSESRIPHRLQR